MNRFLILSLILSATELIATVRVRADQNQHTTNVQNVRFVCGTEVVPSGPDGHYQDRQFLRIYRGQKLLIERFDARYWVVSMQHPSEEDGPWRDPGKKPRLLDLTGDGVPELVVQRWTGGVHGSYSYEVFRTAPKFERIWMLDAKDGHLDFKEQAGQLPTLVVEDTTFAYWNCGFAGSPRLPVAYRWTGQSFQMVQTEMTRPAEFPKRAAEVSSALREIGLPERDRQAPVGDRWPLSSVFTPQLLELIFSGHADLAWVLLSDSWPKQQVSDLPAFRHDFLIQLKKSPHWNELKRLNRPGSLAN